MNSFLLFALILVVAALAILGTVVLITAVLIAKEEQSFYVRRDEP